MLTSIRRRNHERLEMKSLPRETKTCEGCGRTIEWRKAWARDWNEVKYCSQNCKKNKKRDGYEELILNLLVKRGAGKTICPSEVLDAAQKQNKEIMEDVRVSARKLVQQGQVLIMQQGHVVDPSTAKGPIRLKLAR